LPNVFKTPLNSNPKIVNSLDNNVKVQEVKDNPGDPDNEAKYYPGDPHDVLEALPKLKQHQVGGPDDVHC